MEARGLPKQTSKSTLDGFRVRILTPRQLLRSPGPLLESSFGSPPNFRDVPTQARTITRLTREDQFNLEEFRKFKVAVCESGVLRKEDSYDQMLFKDLVRRFLLQQKNQVTFETSESDSRVIHSLDSLQESSAQGASSVPSAEGASSSDQGIPHPPGLPQPQPTEPQVRRRITGKQPPSEFEVNMITSLKQGILEINEHSVNSDQREEDQELQLLQDLKLQEWYQGDLQGYSESEVKEAIKKELISLSSAGHEVYDPVPLNLLSSEDQAKIIESRRVIGPRSGQLKARFVGKGYAQIIDKESKYAHTPQATTLKIILLMSQSHKWSLCVSDVASAFLNTPIDGSKGFIHVQAPPETQYPEPTVWRLKRQLYGLRDSPNSWQVHLNQVVKSLNLSQMKSDPCTFTGKDSTGHLNLMVMAYVDDLVVAGEAQAVQEFIQEIQKTFSLKHVDYLTPDNPVEFLGRIIKVKKSGQITMEFPQKLIDNLLGLFEVKRESTTNGVKIQQVSKEDQIQCEKGDAFKIQDSYRQALVDVTTQR